MSIVKKPTQIRLEALVDWCDQRVNRRAVPDFPGAHNGLQCANRGEVCKIGAAVDAGQVTFEKAVAAGVDFLIVHHGMFWTPPIPLNGVHYAKVAYLIENNCAVYASHLPLDCHPEIGNNVLIARKLGLEPAGVFCPYQGVDIGILTSGPQNRAALVDTLSTHFSSTLTAIEYGSAQPERVAILSGSGADVVPDLLMAAGVDTLITGELRQRHYTQAQEYRFNLYACGHYATEVFGVQALAAEAARHFKLPWEFIPTDCPL